MDNIKELLDQLSLEEKAALCSGDTTWTTKELERLDIPSVYMADGPHGLRKAEGIDLARSQPATCFPTASGLGASWNTDLLERIGAALGRECQAHDVQLLLGPGINIKRSPLCGRNFEYFSEDPYLTGKLAVAFIRGLQGQGVGACIKHFAANNQEYERMTNNSVVDERSLHEIYFPAFEMAIREAQPWAVMCAYNRVNGIPAAENYWLLHTVLKKNWNFTGIVISDWGAVNDRPQGIEAGLHLEMPGSGGVNDQKIIEKVKEGKLKEERLDEIVGELLEFVLKAHESRRAEAAFDEEEHHQLACEAAGESIVLLQNEDEILPLDGEEVKKIALIGGFARDPRYQGAGSSQVNPLRLTNVHDALREQMGEEVKITSAPGYTKETTTNADLIAEAGKKAEEADLAIIFAGLPDSYESEGFDREHIDLPECHNRLIGEIARLQP
ncbi:MAG: glycoside hydrolase family 3 protein, partial [Saprospiraceae bacterium]|nr:glycoside hydrolase family 3 protein [Saprospiraceae bacterium]